MNPYKGLKGLPRNVWLISIGSLINRAGTMELPFLALYLTQGLEFSVSDAGIVIASYGIGSLICAPFAGLQLVSVQWRFREIYFRLLFQLLFGHSEK